MAANNIALNRRFYIPYLLTCVISVAMFFIVQSMSLTDLPGGQTMSAIMQFGVVIIAFFAAVFLFYTNSFLMKRRRRELALYNILGLEKRHIALVLFYETLFCGIIAIGGGLLFGIVLNKLMYMALLSLMHFNVTQSFQLAPAAIASSALLFAGVFLLILLFNMQRIIFSKPIELLLEQSAGEREPKVRWLLVLLGAACLGGGYYIAVTTTDIIAAIMLFFVAVMLVIIGTYCLFTAGSIALLKALKKRKSYYYRPNHFVSVSGMLYRMKQNAVGLSNICILSTMALVTLSSTICLYAGAEDILNAQCPFDQHIAIYYPTDEDEQALLNVVNDETAGQNVQNLQAFESLRLYANMQGDNLSNLPESSADGINHNECELLLLSPEGYTAVTGGSIELNPGEVAVYEAAGHLPDSFRLFDGAYTVAERFGRPIFNGGDNVIGIDDNVFYLVMDSSETVQNICDAQGGLRQYTVRFNIDGTDEEQVALSERIEGGIASILDQTHPDGFSYSPTCRAIYARDMYSFYGSFLFLGLFLGGLFLVTTVLIIYYKQLAEGYEDKSRFAIMQKVGLDSALAKKSIRSQIMTMFFLPLAGAVIHLCFAFPLLRRCLSALYLHNVQLFILSTIGTVLVFSLIYAIVFAVTAKTYYGIVSEQA